MDHEYPALPVGQNDQHSQTKNPVNNALFVLYGHTINQAHGFAAHTQTHTYTQTCTESNCTCMSPENTCLKAAWIPVGLPNIEYETQIQEQLSTYTLTHCTDMYRCSHKFTLQLHTEAT